MTMRPFFIAALAAAAFCAGVGAQGPGTGASNAAAKVEVGGVVHYSGDGSLRHSLRDLGRRTVVWLEPVELRNGEAPASGPFVMTQKDKEFHPRLLVVPVGSAVSFPNADPFFHNVFSLFNGRRFDLGLYQSGQTRSVTFSREGVSYIFCNIHPEMSAVIISLKTPYYGSPDAEGLVTLHGVPAGVYRLGVWSEVATAETLRSLARTVTISRGKSGLGKIEIEAASSGLAEHQNKFGLPYETHSPPNPY